MRELKPNIFLDEGPELEKKYDQVAAFSAASQWSNRSLDEALERLLWTFSPSRGEKIILGYERGKMDFGLTWIGRSGQPRMFGGLIFRDGDGWSSHT